MINFNIDCISATWDFSYNTNVIEKPYDGVPIVTCPQREISVTGIFKPFVVHTVNDFNKINNWFNVGEYLIKCPLFFNTINTAGNITTSLEDINGQYVIRFFKDNIKTPFIFSHFTPDTVIDVNNLTNNYTFKLKITPVERGFQKRKKGNTHEIGEIPFIVS